MNTQLVHRRPGHIHVMRNNAKEDQKLQAKLSRLKAGSLCNMDKIKDEMIFLKKQLMENRKVLATRSDLRDLRADSGINRRRNNTNEVDGNDEDQIGRGQLRKEVIMGREENKLSPRSEVAKTKQLPLPNSLFQKERKLNICRVLETLKEPQISGSLGTTPTKSNRSTGTFSSPCSLSSRFSHDPSTAGGSLTRRAQVRWAGRPSMFGSVDLDHRHTPHTKGRRFSLPGHITPVSPTSIPIGKVPGSILNKANLVPQTQNSAPEITRKGKTSTQLDHSAKPDNSKKNEEDVHARVRRYSLPICNFIHEQGNAADAWLLMAKRPLGKYSKKDPVHARSSQLSSLGSINGNKTAYRAGYGKRPTKVTSPLIESSENGVMALKRNAGVNEDLTQNTEEEVELEDDDQDDDCRPSEDPELKNIPKITLNEKMQRFFADYVEGAGQTGGVDFEHLLMECRMAEDETSEN